MAFDSIEANLLTVSSWASGEWGIKPSLALLGPAELSSIMPGAPLRTLLEGLILQRLGLPSEFLHRHMRSADSLDTALFCTEAASLAQ